MNTTFSVFARANDVAGLYTAIFTIGQDRQVWATSERSAMKRRGYWSSWSRRKDREVGDTVHATMIQPCTNHRLINTTPPT